MRTSKKKMYRRHPYLVLSWEEGELQLIICDTLRRFRVDEPLLQLLSALTDWKTGQQVEELGVSEGLLEDLCNSGVLQVQDDASVVYHWNPFDLVVHRLSNIGGFSEERVQARGLPPPPAFRDPPTEGAIPLPDPDDLDGSLDDLLQRRRSVRAYSDRPLAAAELSTLLHHSARVQRVIQDDQLGTLSLRPFASGGARSELEIYVVANNVQSLEPTAYWYDARAHELYALEADPDYQPVLNGAIHGATGGLNTDPAAVLLITAVFERVMWKYEGIGLSLIHKNVGCLLQTLYLVATELGLAPCALGAQPEYANARWLGLDPLVEAPVGGFIVGPAT